MEVEFGCVGGGGGGVGVQTHFHVKPNSVEVVLRLSWGCENNNLLGSIFQSYEKARERAEAQIPRITLR